MSELRSSSRLPDYVDLPRGVSGAGTAWGIFGPGDGLGLMNLQTPERVARAMRLGRQGQVFALSAPVDLFDPPFFARRTAPRHTVFQRNARSSDDVWDNFFPQGSSQWDGLGHVGAADDGFYGGATAEDVRTGRRNSIDAWAARGIVGRGVVLDVADLVDSSGEAGAAGTRPRVAESVPITVADLERARERAGLTFEAGDIMLVHTGFVGWYESLAPEGRAGFVADGVRNAGLAHGEEMVAYLWDQHVSAVAVDNVAVEVWPPDQSADAYPFGFLHHVLIGEFGMALGELWRLGDLAASCRADGVYECAVVSAPMRSPGGTGSPANAVAVK
jgi:kynurenine formamidase